MILPKKNIPLLMMLIVSLTVACTNKTEEKSTPKPNKEAIAMDIPKHPGTIKMVTMLDNSVEIIPINKLPKSSHYVYFDEDNVRTEQINKAVKAIPIVEERMYSRGENEKLVPVNEANYLWIEKYGPNQKLLKTSTIWRNGKRGGKRKSE